MKRLWMLCAGLAIVVICMNVYAEVDKKAASKDWLAMEKLMDEKGNFLSKSEFEKSPETFVKNWLDFSKRFTREYESFTKKYGSEREVLLEVFEDVTKPLEATREHYQLINELTDLNVQDRTKAIVDWADRAGRDSYRGWESMKDPAPEKFELKLKRARHALMFFEAAKMLNPDGDYGDFISKAKDAVKETEPMVKKALESQVWPGHNTEYAGPGKPGDIAAAALEFLKKKPNWSKPEYDDVHTPYAACVTGNDWVVSKKAPLTHVPTQYSLNIMVAFTGEKDPDIAYVYHMVFYTAEEGGIEKGLPLKYANSRQYAKFQMLLDNVPKGSSGGSTGGGGFGLWRLLMALFLIAGGIIGAGAFLSGKLPQIKGVVSILTGLSLPVGFVLAVLGLGGFLCNLVRFSPLASILPQLVALALGIVFLRKSPMFKMPAVTAPAESSESDAPAQKASKPAEILSKFAFLDSMESTLGFAALILGFLHLIMGGVGLF